MRQPYIARDAVGEPAEELAHRCLQRQLRVERKRRIPGYVVGAAIGSGEQAHLVAVRVEAGAVADTEPERRAVRQHHLQHVPLRGPVSATANSCRYSRDRKSTRLNSS